jgi:hypothetical protein
MSAMPASASYVGRPVRPAGVPVVAALIATIVLPFGPSVEYRARCRRITGER